MLRFSSFALLNGRRAKTFLMFQKLTCRASFTFIHETKAKMKRGKKRNSWRLPLLWSRCGVSRWRRSPWFLWGSWWRWHCSSAWPPSSGLGGKGPPKDQTIPRDWTERWRKRFRLINNLKIRCSKVSGLINVSSRGTFRCPFPMCISLITVSYFSQVVWSGISSYSIIQGLQWVIWQNVCIAWRW